MIELQIGELLARLSINTQSWREGLDQGQSDVRQFGQGTTNSLGGVKDSVFTLKNAVVGYVTAITGGKTWKWLVDGNTQMETFSNTLETTLKSKEKAKDYLDWATTFAASTPFEIPGIIEATVKLANYGMDAKKVLPAVGDMAAVMGKSIDQAVEAVADAQTGELERLKEFGITKKMLVEQLEKDGQVGVVNARGQIVDQEKFNAALFKLMNERYSGGMAKQATTMTGMMSNLSDAWGTLGRTVGSGLFEKLKDGLQILLAKINELQANGTIKKWADITGDAITKVATVVFGLFTMIMGDGAKGKAILEGVFGVSNTAMLYGFIATIRGIITAIVDVVGWLDKMGILKPLLVGLTAGFVAFKVAVMIDKAILAVNAALVILRTSTTLATIAQWAFNSAFLANPITLIVIAMIAVLAALGYVIYKNWDSIKKFLTDIWTSMKVGFVATWTSISTFFRNLWSGIGIWFRTTLSGISTFFSGIWKAMGNTITNAGVSIKATAKAIVDGIIGSFKWLYDHNYYIKDLVDFIVNNFNYLKNIIPKIWGEITAYLDKTWTAISGKVREVWTAIVTWLTTMWTSISTKATEIWNAISNAVSTKAREASNALHSVFDPIANWLAGIWNSISAKVTEVWNSIKGSMTSKSTEAVSSVKNIFGGVKDWFFNLASEAYNWGANIIKSIARGIRDFGSQAADAASGVARKIASFLGFHSPTKEGPGSDSDTWMPNLMGMLTKGIKGGTGSVHNALNAVMNPKVGANLVNNNTSAGGAGGNQGNPGSGFQINIAKMEVRNDGDIKKVSEELHRLMQSKKRGVGIV